MAEVKLDILVGAKDQGVGQAMQRIQGQLDTVGTKAALAGAAITAAMSKAAFAGAAYGDELAKMSKRTGVAVEQLSKLRYAAEQEDVAFEELGNGLRFLARNMDSAREGSGEAADAFKALGVKVTGTHGELRPIQEVLLEVSDGLAKTTNQTERAALSMLVFGRSGTQMLPMLQEGSEYIESLTKRAEELGLVVSGDAASAAEQFGDRWAEVKSSLVVTSLVVTEALLPAMESLQESVSGATEYLRAMDAAHPGLIRHVAQLGAGLLLVGGTLKVIAGTMRSIAAIQGGLTAMGIGGAAATGAAATGAAATGGSLAGNAAGAVGGAIVGRAVAPWPRRLAGEVGTRLKYSRFGQSAAGGAALRGAGIAGRGLLRAAGPVGWAALAGEAGVAASRFAGGKLGQSRGYGAIQERAPWLNKALNYMPGGFLTGRFAEASYLEDTEARSREMIPEHLRHRIGEGLRETAMPAIGGVGTGTGQAARLTIELGDGLRAEWAQSPEVQEAIAMTLVEAARGS